MIFEFLREIRNSLVFLEMLLLFRQAFKSTLTAKIYMS
jgi:hypothetical protein